MDSEGKVIEIRCNILKHAIERHENEIDYLKQEIECLGTMQSDYCMSI